MAKFTTQLELRFHDEAYWWFGRDRLSGPIVVGNKDFAESLKEVKRQIKSAIDQNEIQGTAVCTATPEELLETLKVSPRLMTLWVVDSFA